MFEVNNKDTRTTPLGFRIFDSKRHHSILSTFKNMFWERQKTVTKSKIRSTGFTGFTLTGFNFLLHIKFSGSDYFTPRSSKTKCYKELNLSRCSEGLSTGVAGIFMRGGRKSDVMDFLYDHEL